MTMWEYASIAVLLLGCAGIIMTMKPWDLDQGLIMRNSTFFQEAVFVANKALKHPDPLGKGIDSGLRDLKYTREGSHPKVFEETIFNRYAVHYEKIARALVQEYLIYQDAKPYNGEEH